MRKCPHPHTDPTCGWCGKCSRGDEIRSFLHISIPSTTTATFLYTGSGRYFSGTREAEMKFTITREQFQEGLQAVAGSVPTKTTLPVLSNILVEATHDGVRLSGTDLDIAVSTTVPASVDQEGSITVPARKLAEIVRELPNASIRITASGEQR